MDSIKALKYLRQQLKKDYPDNSPVFRSGATKPEEIKFFFDDMVLPAFEKIQKEFDLFHFEVKFVRFPYRTRLEVTDGCSQFYFSIFVDKKHSFAAIEAEYRDYSIYPQHSQYFKKKDLLDERFDLSRIRQELSEELIIEIFSNTFLNRKVNLRAVVNKEKYEIEVKEELEREERRFKLNALKERNGAFDPEDEFKKYLDSDEYIEMMRWLDSHYNIKIVSEEDLQKLDESLEH
jgi:hypothetical protein